MDWWICARQRLSTNTSSCPPRRRRRNAHGDSGKGLRNSDRARNGRHAECLHDRRWHRRLFEHVAACTYRFAACPCHWARACAFQREADYVGAYYAARAGYDLAGAEDIWRAFSLENPDSIRIARDHPITPVRFVQMQKAAAEIADKQRRHAPLIPELKVIQTEAEPAMSSGEKIH